MRDLKEVPQRFFGNDEDNKVAVVPKIGISLTFFYFSFLSLSLFLFLFLFLYLFLFLILTSFEQDQSWFSNTTCCTRGHY